ncbi:ficolin-2-like [Haliotis asinina]|uniref:ficolin-2-like n=1 Tax=Haliotis asinina TaxID=109174 RepID=UPI00353204C1
MGERVPGDITPLVIHPLTSPSPFTVSCYLAWGGFTYIEKRIGGACPDVDFNRTWTELKHFLGDVTCSYWLGLEHIHQLTSQNTYMLDMYITAPFGFGGHALYSDFRLGSEGQGYKFLYNSYVEHGYPADDGFAYGSNNGVNGFNFSTVDRPDQGGCVSRGAAWWYGSNCPEVNLHLPMKTGGVSDPAIWVNDDSQIEVTTLVAQLSTVWP